MKIVTNCTYVDKDANSYAVISEFGLRILHLCFYIFFLDYEMLATCSNFIKVLLI